MYSHLIEINFTNATDGTIKLTENELTPYFHSGRLIEPAAFPTILAGQAVKAKFGVPAGEADSCSGYLDFIISNAHTSFQHIGIAFSNSVNGNKIGFAGLGQTAYENMEGHSDGPLIYHIDNKYTATCKCTGGQVNEVIITINPYMG